MMSSAAVLERTGSETHAGAATMKALVYHGPGRRSWEEMPKPRIEEATDAVVRITTTTICGTDLHILKGDVPSVDRRTHPRPRRRRGRRGGRGRGHELPQGRPRPHLLHHLLRPLRLLQARMYSHCRTAAGSSGNTIDGTQAEYVRIPHADTSLYALPPNADEEAIVMLSDILPTGFECGVLNGQVKPGDTVAIVGAGPIGLAALLTAQLYSPSEIIVVDLDENRLEMARTLGATRLVNSADGKAVESVMALTGGVGVDVAIEAVGIPATFDICQSIVAPGGRIANIGVHGKPVQLHLERLWSHNITLTTRLVDTAATPTLMKMVETGRLQPKKLATHQFQLDEVMEAYDTFGNAAREGALKVILRNR